MTPQADIMARIAEMRQELSSMARSLKVPRVRVQFDRLIDVVAAEFQVERVCLLDSAKEQRLAHARHALALLFRRHTDLSYPAIGRLVNRHHTTILASERRCKALAARSEQFREKLAACEARLRGQA